MDDKTQDMSLSPSHTSWLEDSYSFSLLKWNIITLRIPCLTGQTQLRTMPCDSMVTYKSLSDIAWCCKAFFDILGPIGGKLHEIEPCLSWLLLCLSALHTSWWWVLGNAWGSINEIISNQIIYQFLGRMNIFLTMIFCNMHDFHLMTYRLYDHFPNMFLEHQFGVLKVNRPPLCHLGPFFQGS